MYQVLETYKRFDQKNNMISRLEWDLSLRYYKRQRDKTRFRHMEQGVIGFKLKDFALTNASGVLVSTLGAAGMNQPNLGLTSWLPLPYCVSFTLPEKKSRTTNDESMSKEIKRVARFLGADLVGIAKLDPRWVYSHHYILSIGQSIPVQIDERFQYVVTMAVEMDYPMMRTAPSSVAYAETYRAYSKMTFLVSGLAQFIRQLGYSAIPSLNDTALNIPLAVDSGLGELGRMGLLITPKFGPRQRLCKVITDLPLKVDQPIEFGVTTFCSVCQKCAKECPAQAISNGAPTTEVSSISSNPGVMKWPLYGEKCCDYWCRIGTDCSICIRVCPFNKGKGWIHDMSRWFVKHAPVVDQTMVKMDELIGYGKFQSPDCFWNQNV